MSQEAAQGSFLEQSTTHSSTDPNLAQKKVDLHVVPEGQYPEKPTPKINTLSASDQIAMTEKSLVNAVHKSLELLGRSRQLAPWSYIISDPEVPDQHRKVREFGQAHGQHPDNISAEFQANSSASASGGAAELRKAAKETWKDEILPAARFLTGMAGVDPSDTVNSFPEFERSFFPVNKKQGKKLRREVEKRAK